MRCGVDLDLRAVRNKTHKLTLQLKSGVGELYGLDDDPDEMVKRFGDGAYSKVRRELSDMIANRPDDTCALLPQVGMA